MHPESYHNHTPHQDTNIQQVAEIIINRWECWRMGTRGFTTMDISHFIILRTVCQRNQGSTSSSMDINNRLSKVSSALGCKDSRAPRPTSKLASSEGTSHVRDSARRLATNTNIGPSRVEPKRRQESSAVFSRTGSNVNHRPKAAQNGVSFGKLRILYDIRIFSSGCAKGCEES